MGMLVYFLFDISYNVIGDTSEIRLVGQETLAKWLISIELYRILDERLCSRFVRLKQDMLVKKNKKRSMDQQVFFL